MTIPGHGRPMIRAAAARCSLFDKNQLSVVFLIYQIEEMDHLRPVIRRIDTLILPEKAGDDQAVARKRTLDTIAPEVGHISCGWQRPFRNIAMRKL